MLNRPPNIRTLMEDPVFAKFMRTRPRMPASALDPRIPPAWVVWVLTSTDKWQKKEVRSYDEAYRIFKKLLPSSRVQDIAIVSKRVMLGPPVGYSWSSSKFPWCARCRRPSLFLESLSHRALGAAEFTEDEPIRCYYCGIRRAALPRYVPS